MAGVAMTADNAATRALPTVSRRWRALDDEAKELTRHIKPILDEIAGALVARHGVGYETAGQLLVAAGPRPTRRRHSRSSR
jgi:transposase